ncbi:MAG TPA: peptidylprolyl isomerase [Saprospiraceae bacterium]|nr:peptidylprolyl isomerase [Saprospiraceae bacterium]
MIQVNQVILNEQRILSEMQYHPASSQREAMMKAAEALIIGELLRQRAVACGITSAANPDSDAAEFVDLLLQQELRIPQATEDECRQYFNSNPQKFISSPLIELQHILLAATDDELDRISVKQEADALLIKLQLGHSFDDLAKTCSSCPSKDQAGDLGVISRGQTVPEFERKILQLPLGLHSQPIESRYGFHLVKINRITPGQPQSFEECKQRIADYLQERVKRKEMAHYIQQLISEADIEGYDFSVPASPLMQ